MKILIFILLVYLSLFAARDIYAANTTLISNYPAPSGSYNKVVMAPQSTTNVDCSTASNTGLLFMDTSTNTLKLCASVNSQPVTVPSGETCFNRFCTSTTASACSFSAPTCPAGYTQAKSNGGQPIVDHFTASAGYTVYSTVCCTSGSTVLPNS